MKKEKMKNKDEILKVLKSLQSELKKFKVRDIGIFGSVVRGEHTQTSDIDLLVDFADDADLFDLVGLGLFLEEKLGQKVDIVPKKSLRKELRDRVLKEIVTV